MSKWSGKTENGKLGIKVYRKLVNIYNVTFMSLFGLLQMGKPTIRLIIFS
jgi:hypothetical protein